MKFHLRIWRQKGPQDKGKLVSYTLEDVSSDTSFLEMLDQLNHGLILAGEDPVAFDHDCREGICGSCGFMVNGVAHGRRLTTVCQLFMRHFEDGAKIVIEPFRSRAFPVIKDLALDRRALDSIIRAGGYITAETGRAPEANAIPVPKETAERSLDAASCIGCGACVAACPNGSAMLFTAAKISHLGLLPQGRAQAHRRALAMEGTMSELGFGHCSNHAECEAVCPKGIDLQFIAILNREFTAAALHPEPKKPEERVETL